MNLSRRMRSKTPHTARMRPTAAIFARTSSSPCSMPLPMNADSAIAYGVNADDTLDFRPGHRAATEHQVLAPLLEANLRKAEIRELSRRAGLPTWDRPASACLSSRIPYGTEVTPERLALVERGEAALRALGFRQFRVRLHEKLARIEVAPEEMARATNAEIAAAISRELKRAGFTYVALDLDGYRQGSLNEALPDAAGRSSGS